MKVYLIRILVHLVVSVLLGNEYLNSWQNVVEDFLDKLLRQRSFVKDIVACVE